MLPSYLLNRPFLPIVTERLTLRPLEEKDVVTIEALANNRQIAEKLARLPHPYTREDASQFITYAKTGITRGAYVILAVIRRVDQTFMGVVGLEEDLGYWLGQEFWGQGYGKEAIKAFVQFAFSILQVKDLRANARVDNLPSRCVLEGLGFSQVGTKECTSLGYEGVRPSVRYSLSRETFIERLSSVERPLLWAAAAALINQKGEMLVTERLLGKHLAGVWELPGGKMELGETPEQALIRELREELSIEVKQDHLEPLNFVSYPYETFHLIMPIYLCRQWEGPLHGAEGQKISWITYPDLAHYPLPPAALRLMHPLVDALKERGIWGAVFKKKGS